MGIKMSKRIEWIDIAKGILIVLVVLGHSEISEVAASVINSFHMAAFFFLAGLTTLLYDYLHKELYSYHVIQADETPVLVNRDGRKAGSKSWMWVYRSGHLYQEPQIVLYEYQQTRNVSHPREFLKGFDGICVTDGYQVYHTLEKELEELTIAGC